MKYCSSCGSAVAQRIPEGDNRERHVCDDCGTIHYQNPRIVAGCLVTEDDRVLLCQRAINPRSGYWTLPAGFLENGETVAAGAARETWEEACARVTIEGLYTIFSLPHISQVYMFYRASLRAPAFAPGEETLACGWYREAEVPWDTLAFPVIDRTLRHFFADRRSGEFPVRAADIIVPRR